MLVAGSRVDEWMTFDRGLGWAASAAAAAAATEDAKSRRKRTNESSSGRRLNSVLLSRSQNSRLK